MHQQRAKSLLSELVSALTRLGPSARRARRLRRCLQPWRGSGEQEPAAAAAYSYGKLVRPMAERVQSGTASCLGLVRIRLLLGSRNHLRGCVRIRPRLDRSL